jgi:hypothetical protein
MALSIAEDMEESLSQPEDPSHEDIARLAYALWEARGGTSSSPEEDWFAAEAELRRR